MILFADPGDDNLDFVFLSMISCNGLTCGELRTFLHGLLMLLYLIVSISEAANMGSLKDDASELAARFEKLGVKNSSVRTEIYPPIEPYTTGMLSVSDKHTLYWEESGNPDGQVRSPWVEFQLFLGLR